MIIIIEAGATKSDWRILEGGRQRQLLLPGMNVSTSDERHNLDVLSRGLAEAGAPRIDGLFLYVAGIVTPEVRERYSAYVRTLAAVGLIEINDDLVAAARAVCGNDPGIVAILGTGSNACFWDGTAVSFKVRSGGYILGDEGGGAVLGKLFLADFLKGRVPGEVAEAFAERFDSSYSGIVASVYRSESPAGYLGGLAPFILSHYSNPYVKELVDGNFRSFVTRSLLSYPVDKYPVGVVGGFGSACRDILEPICAEYGVRISRFEKEPISGLIKYHSL